MRLLIADTLRPLVDASADAIRRLGGQTQSELRVEPVADRDIPTGLSAVLTLSSGPARRIVFGCDEHLARHVATRLLPPVDPNDATDTDDRRLRAGFQIALHVFTSMLADHAPWFRPTEERIEYGPGSFETRTVGRRTFLVDVACPQGALHVIAGLTSEDRAQTAETDILPAGAGREYALSPDERRLLVRRIVDLELDLELEIQGPGREVAASPATIVDADLDAGLLAVTSPCVPSQNVYLPPGTRVVCNVANNGTLYRFDSTAVRSPRESLCEDIALPLLWIRTPSAITRVERRRASRIVPRDTVLVDLEEWIATEGAEEAPLSASNGRLCDVSPGGMRVALPEGSHASLRSRLVLAQFVLPEGWGLVGLPGIIRHVDESGADGIELGIEFLSVPAWHSFHGARERIRQYVTSETRARLPEYGGVRSGVRRVRG